MKDVLTGKRGKRGRRKLGLGAVVYVSRNLARLMGDMSLAAAACRTYSPPLDEKKMPSNDSVDLVIAATTRCSTASVFTVVIPALRACFATSASPFSLVFKPVILTGNTHTI